MNFTGFEINKLAPLEDCLWLCVYGPLKLDHRLKNARPEKTMETLSSKILAANVALFEEGNREAIPDFFATDYIAHLTGQNLAGGHQLIRGMLDLYRRAFPDPKVEVEIFLEGADRVSWQRTIRAKHEGAFKGFPASGREILWRDVVTSRFRGALIAEEWVISDLAEQLLLSRKRA
jgi:predicted ester cyclase